MEHFSKAFQWLGSFSSIIAIPLTLYIYYKSQIGKEATINREIIYLLEAYIGQGNVLTITYIKSIINSKKKEHNFNTHEITIESLIDDLTTDVISNPLLTNEEKNKYLSEIKNISIPFRHSNDILYCIKSSRLKKHTIDEDEKKRKKRGVLFRSADICMVILCVIASMVASFLSFVDLTKYPFLFDFDNPAALTILGIVISLIIGALIWAIEWVLNRIPRK